MSKSLDVLEDQHEEINQIVSCLPLPTLQIRPQHNTV